MQGTLRTMDALSKRRISETFLSGDTSVGNTLSRNHSQLLTFHLKLGKAFPQILMSTSYVHNKSYVDTKEVIKEQPPSRNLSATARRVLQCTRSQLSVVKLHLLGQIFRLFSPYCH